MISTEEFEALKQQVEEMKERLEMQGKAIEGLTDLLGTAAERFEKHEEYIKTLFTAVGA